MASAQSRRRMLWLLAAGVLAAAGPSGAARSSPRLILSGPGGAGGTGEAGEAGGAGGAGGASEAAAAARPGNRTCGHCVCGLGRRTRIVNGELAASGEFPWAVGLDYHGAHHCGASLVTRRHLLTAAHCIDGFQRRHLTARLADGSRYPIDSATVHRDYDKRTFDNDIAVLELQRPVPLDGAAGTVCLPSSPSFGYEGATGVAIGWGRVGEGKPVSEQLRKVQLPIMSKRQCLRSGYPDGRLTDNMFCAGYLQGERDSCNGDSGGALHVRNDHAAMEIVGIVSFGRGCARPNFPGVYTKISNYLQWIGQHLDDECLCSSPASRLG